MRRNSSPFFVCVKHFPSWANKPVLSQFFNRVIGSTKTPFLYIFSLEKPPLSLARNEYVLVFNIPIPTKAPYPIMNDGRTVRVSYGASVTMFINQNAARMNNAASQTIFFSARISHRLPSAVSSPDSSSVSVSCSSSSFRSTARRPTPPRLMSAPTGGVPTVGVLFWLP